MQPAQLLDLRLSVVVVTNTGLRSLFPILAALKDQTIASDIELIIVGPQLDQHEVEACCGNVFGRVRGLSVGPIQNRGRAATHGIMAASAPFVALTENHCFPVSNWAERLLEGYDDSISGVGPSVLNANPETLLSWTTFALGYGDFAPTMPAETRHELPYHNSSYRTAVLRRLGNQLPELLADERRLFSQLREFGCEALVRTESGDPPSQRGEMATCKQHHVLLWLALCGYASRKLAPLAARCVRGGVAFPGSPNLAKSSSQA